MSSRNKYLALFACLALALVAWKTLPSRSEPDKVTASSKPEEGQPSPPSGTSRRKKKQEKSRPQPSPKREKLLAALADLRNKKTPPSTQEATDPTPFSLARGEGEDISYLFADYALERLSTVSPLLQECYELHNDPAQEKGYIDVELRVIGGLDAGLPVSETSISGGTLAHNKEFSECITETLMTVEFDPPDDPEGFFVRLPIHFSQTPEEEEESEL